MHPIIEVSTVVGCFLNCRYCPQTIHVKNYAEQGGDFKMSLENFRRCIDKLPPSVEIQFAGMAEPWLNPACTDMILHAHDRGHTVAVFTTAVGITPEDVSRLKHIPFHHFCIHLPDDSGQMKLKVDEKYLAGLIACLDIKGHTLMCVGKVHPNVRAAIGRDVADGTPALISRAGNLKEMPRKTGELKRLPCMDHNVLLPNGNVVLCCMDFGSKHVIGNLLEQSYDSVFTGPQFTTILRGLEDESVDILCRTCEIAECV